MKLLRISLIVLGLAIALANSATAASLVKQLVDLESHIKWSAVDKAWRERRPDWINNCKGATTRDEAAKLFLELEQNVRWQAIDENWKALRDDWITRVKGE